MPDMRLPPELLIQICELATKIPSELNTEGITLFERCRHQEAINDRQLVMKTRRTLPLVSKKFYNLSIEFLYQSISVLRGTTFDYLRRTLQSGSSHPDRERDTNGEGVSQQSHSRFANLVKRLDIVFIKRKFPYISCEGILQLLPLLPKVEILTLHGNSFLPYSDELFDSIEYLHELKLLHLPPNLSVKHASMLSRRLKSPESTFFKLRILESNILGRIDVIEESRIRNEVTGHSRPPTDRIPGYNIGWMDTSHKWISTSHAPLDPHLFFPQLKALTLTPGFQCNIQFLQAHGHKIITIFLFDPTSLFDYHQYLPNLRDVILKTDRIFWKFPEYSKHKRVASLQVKRVGISTTREQFGCKFFDQALTDLPLYFPNMECLRILDKRTIRYLKQPPWLTRIRWTWRSQTRKYRLEGENGELLFGTRGY